MPSMSRAESNPPPAGTCRVPCRSGSSWGSPGRPDHDGAVVEQSTPATGFGDAEQAPRQLIAVHTEVANEQSHYCSDGRGEAREVFARTTLLRGLDVAGPEHEDILRIFLAERALGASLDPRIQLRRLLGRIGATAADEAEPQAWVGRNHRRCSRDGVVVRDDHVLLLADLRLRNSEAPDAGVRVIETYRAVVE